MTNITAKLVAPKFDDRTIFESQQSDETQDTPDNIWYLVPLLFGLLGGIIMYAALRNEDEDMALRGLYLGLGVTVMCVLLAWWLF